ncbi:methionine synthase [Methanoplanus limicola]|uniref:Methionine synthase vitamin-B12 independent n=1 Tax=Methanoplanus limicola DSM 2279 TaxID=937775 RepID=H1Z453_9EURY|nr:methionine synthase [Methanoplanus limicola]EHQ35732.1 Methionine synthase vitamin-B12 independent [Methanoplanus limicola DSM 2279]
MTLMQKLLPTTVVGSYPAIQGKGLKSILDPFQPALETAVNDQIKAGIDIISSGQVRGDMISQIISLLPGIRGNNVTGMVQAPSKPITVHDTKYAVSKHERVKAMFAGPSTIAHALKIDTPVYRNKNELVLDLAQALAHEAKNLENAGITILQIDEPILSTGAADMATAHEAISAITGAVRVPACLHVCGNIGSVFDDIIKMPVEILDFEFACNPENLEYISGKDLKNKMIGFGVVDSSSEKIDSVEEIYSRILKATDLFDPAKILIDPDCGLRMHTRETAFAKLKNMVSAADMVRNEL